MTDTLKLKGAMVASGMSRREIADKMGISVATLHRKLHNQAEFRSNEIQTLSMILGITNKDEIFFT